MALGAVLGQLAAAPSLPQKDRADYHDEALQALQQAYACDPDDVDIMYNLAVVQVHLLFSYDSMSSGASTLCHELSEALSILVKQLLPQG